MANRRRCTWWGCKVYSAKSQCRKHRANWVKNRRAWMARQRSTGGCADCSAPAKPGMSRCEQHRRCHNARLQANYRPLPCSSCGSTKHRRDEHALAKALAGACRFRSCIFAPVVGAYCDSHRPGRRVWRARIRVGANGMCHRCGHRPKVTSSRCEPCRVYAVEYQRAYAERRAADVA